MSCGVQFHQLIYVPWGVFVFVFAHSRAHKFESPSYKESVSTYIRPSDNGGRGVMVVVVPLPTILGIAM